MYTLRMRKHVLMMRTFLVVLLFGSCCVRAQYDCNVCQNSPYGQRTLKSPESVINSSKELHAKLHKRHNMLSFHYVREAVATGFLHLTHIPGKINPADMLSKHWGYSDVKDILKALLFHRGDTAELGQNTTTSK
ncbi:hypothetical protein IV203_021036 [Nitzschia inconspicua]|uniref:Uncharacterized protein n=1 Tax=Nitzschia inconspicua TaxID=303405 RepID=A0A9K3PDV3_9STRA|nr:hypothetical protein IV203_021036 [Nitzschia inconspicua]